MNTFLFVMKRRLRGKEILKLDNGDLYVGDIDHLSYIPKSWGILTGKGMYKWANGNLYEGSFVEGLSHGKGVYKSGVKDYEVEIVSESESDNNAGKNFISLKSGTKFPGLEFSEN